MRTSTSEAPPLGALAARLKARAREECFSACGICAPDAIPQAAGRLAAFVAAGWHGRMGWMAERMGWRGSPPALWPEARSVVMLAEAYTPEEDPLAVLARPDRGAISVYARGRDYHDLLKRRLKRLGRWLVAETGAEIKVFVDTAPVMEKPLAQAAGLGWQGKHTNLVGRELGSWFFLGAIFTTLKLPRDGAEPDRCGSCRACLDVCPTRAFPAPYRLDARRCISYLTIEHDGPVDPELRPLIGNRIYGCDDCLAVCPWNKFAVAAREIGYRSREGLDAPELGRLAGLDDAAFRARFSGSPIKRIGRGRFVRNVLYAIGNSGDPRLRAAAAGLAEDADPVVRDAAAWAMARLDAGRRGAESQRGRALAEPSVSRAVAARHAPRPRARRPDPRR
jgi:epoxyqueuosine reductase